MRKIDISISATFSILIGVISLWIFLTNGYRMMAYQPLELANLSEQNIKEGRYVKGTITDCFTVPNENPNRRVGSDAEFIAMPNVYTSYTVPIAVDRYIRVWIYDTESQEGMERIVHGDATEVSFVGQIKKGGSLNTEFYARNPEFDQSKIVADYEVWQKSPDVEKNICLAGLFGMLTAILIYYFSGGIHIIEVCQRTDRRREVVRNYDKENELAIAKIRLEKYRQQEKVYCKKCIMGILCFIMGFYIVFVLDMVGLKIIGLILMIYGVKKCWDFFINSKNRCAVKIATLFSMKTLQMKRAAEERKIKEIEQESFSEK